MQNNLVKVLDHGFVRLVDHMGSDLSVVRAARVSYAEEWRAGEDTGSDSRLINYLWKNKHSTPFEAVTFTFEIKAPIFVFRQWHRHRTWTYNELSGRYRELPEEFYVPDITNIGVQSKANKQGRDINVEDVCEYTANREFELVMFTESCKDSFRTYKMLLEAGWPKELARSVLPVNTYSHMFATVNMLNLFKFFQLRSHAHAQYEIRQFSNAMQKLIKDIVPVSYAAFLTTKTD